ncbi:MAG: TRAP transporter substrate-binding protein [Bacteroidota bacterium]
MKNKQQARRDFLKKASAVSAIATAGLSSCVSSDKHDDRGPYINFNNTYRWKMTTTWPPNFPITGEGCKMIADYVKQMSGGRMEIIVYGAGELIPALEGFDAVSNGAVEMNHAAAYYWAGKIPVAPFFTTVPFGMNAQQMMAWMTVGGGQELWDEVYAPYNLMGRMAGNTGFQMGGWFNKEINSLSDLNGVKMRIPGLGGKVFAKAGGTPVLVSGGELYTNLERGVIDATEWIGPYHDYLLGLHQVAKYYYYPGWHETNAVLELLINKDKFNELPSDLQEIIKAACSRSNNWVLSQFNYQNGLYLKKIQEVKSVSIRRFPKEVMDGLRKASKETLDELAANDPLTSKVYTAYNDFRKDISGYMDISEKIFYEEMN